MGFDRLIRKMDSIAKNASEEIIMQIGNTKYKPKYAKYFSVIDNQSLEYLFQKSRLVVAHAGAGTILDILRHEKSLILVPRLKKYNEVIDDQQMELADILAKKKHVITVYDVNFLEKIINDIDTFGLTPLLKRNDLSQFLKNYITQS